MTASPRDLPPRTTVVAPRPSGAAPERVLDATFDALLLDMDGTLLSSLDAVVRAWTRLAEEFAIPADRFGDHHGIPAAGVVDLLLHDREPEERARALARVTELEETDTDGIVLLPGTARLLAALSGSGRVAVVTSCTRGLAAARIAASGLRVPDVVVTADDVRRGKPDPEPYLAGAAALGVDPARCLVVEDATAGAQSARAAGAAVLGLRTTDAQGPRGADLVVPDLDAVDVVVDGAGVRLVLRPTGREEG